ncbi:unnamed protein product [Adineta steineri]|uniref:WxxW domain-containing protein n=1 Tax=Adineta steineri TaxID=433720 RepID=A0A815G8V9_9BILA|nr:unnamed protein product [Adineta steineri]CAF1356426.1 unnamed protein product [Adineta steineri]CAF1396804.1 unnamed protein product [Adineta steineri]CAF4019332.1 unnamed protein product [Adineta steineri]CAF4021761.1 unnamed protein product [Adineta steineri]
MIFAVLFTIFFLNGVLSQQSVFDPYSYTQASCTGSYQWTMWFDTNDPDMSQGDVEITNHIQQLFPTFMCTSPTAIEAQTSFDANPTTTGDIFRISVKDGFLCLNQRVTGYKTKLCTDYKVRYCCLSTSLQN